ncbi:MAG TPA: hypothetical protein VGD74_06120 [Vulgatibacter sp.]
MKIEVTEEMRAEMHAIAEYEHRLPKMQALGLGKQVAARAGVHAFRLARLVAEAVEREEKESAGREAAFLEAHAAEAERLAANAGPLERAGMLAHAADLRGQIETTKEESCAE